MELEQIDIEALKREHGELFKIEMETDDGKTVAGIFKKPTIKVLSAVAKTAETDKIKAALVMYNQCKVEVDPEIEASDELKLSAAEAVGDLFKRYTASVKKV